MLDGYLFEGNAGRSALAEKHIERVQQLASQRAYFESVWKQVADVAAPDAGNFDSGSTLNSVGLPMESPTAAKRSTKIYDTTAINAIDRLASGIEAIVCPQSDYWHGLGIIDVKKSTLTDQERVWLSDQRDLLFRIRYDPDGGFVPAIQTAIRRCIAFGNGFIFVDESFDGRCFIKYRYMPLHECYVAEDPYGQIDAWYRVYRLTAAQAKAQFGDKCPPKIAKDAAKSDAMDTPYMFVHAIFKRDNWGDFSDGPTAWPYASLHIDMDSKSICRESGYTSFPIIDFRWLPEPGRVYGEGPVMKVLADIQSLNVMGKNELTAADVALRPPLLVANAGIMNRPNTNPGAINFGGMAPNGQKLIEPLMTQQRLDFFTQALTSKRAQIKESLYITLFQVLVNNPQMSATEALIRANEKAELLGPAGTRLQAGFSRMVEREMDILVRRGLYDQSSVHAVPRSLQGKKIKVEFTSPLDRMRKTKQGEGTMQLVNALNPIAAVDPTVYDVIDASKAARGLAEIFNVPPEFIRPQEEVDQLKAQRAQQQAMQAQAQAGLQAAQAGKAGAEAMATLKEAQR